MELYSISYDIYIYNTVHIIFPKSLTTPIYKYTYANPKLPFHPSPLAITSLVSIPMSLFHRHVHLCHILDSLYK